MGYPILGLEVRTLQSRAGQRGEGPAETRWRGNGSGSTASAHCCGGCTAHGGRVVTTTILLSLAVATAAPVSFAAAFWILLHTRPNAGLDEAADALAKVFTSCRRQAPPSNGLNGNGNDNQGNGHSHNGGCPHSTRPRGRRRAAGVTRR